MSGTPILVIVVLVSGVLDWLFAGERDADRVGLGRVDGDDLLAVKYRDLWGTDSRLLRACGGDPRPGQ